MSAAVRIQVRYFASLREQLGCEAETVQWTEGQSLAQLRQMLAQQRGEVLATDRIRCARNGEVCADESELLADGDEVAFFPPVTGG